MVQNIWEISGCIIFIAYFARQGVELRKYSFSCCMPLSNNQAIFLLHACYMAIGCKVSYLNCYLTSFIAHPHVMQTLRIHPFCTQGIDEAEISKANNLTIPFYETVDVRLWCKGRPLLQVGMYQYRHSFFLNTLA